MDFPGPINVKFSPIRKPTVVMSYTCVFVSLWVKAVHLEAVLDLTTKAFLPGLVEMLHSPTWEAVFHHKRSWN